MGSAADSASAMHGFGAAKPNCYYGTRHRRIIRHSHLPKRRCSSGAAVQRSLTHAHRCRDTGRHLFPATSRSRISMTPRKAGCPCLRKHLIRPCDAWGETWCASRCVCVRVCACVQQAEKPGLGRIAATAEPKTPSQSRHATHKNQVVRQAPLLQP